MLFIYILLSPLIFIHWLFSWIFGIIRGAFRLFMKPFKMLKEYEG